MQVKFIKREYYIKNFGQIRNFGVNEIHYVKYPAASSKMKKLKHKIQTIVDVVQKTIQNKSLNYMNNLKLIEQLEYMLKLIVFLVTRDSKSQAYDKPVSFTDLMNNYNIYVKDCVNSSLLFENDLEAVLIKTVFVPNMDPLLKLELDKVYQKSKNKQNKHFTKISVSTKKQEDKRQLQQKPLKRKENSILTKFFKKTKTSETSITKEIKRNEIICFTYDPNPDNAPNAIKTNVKISHFL